MPGIKKPRRPKSQPRKRPRQPAGSAAPEVDWSWADANTLQVDSVFLRLNPFQSRGERLELEESIRTEGCRDPIMVWKGHGIVLDGHTRLEFCLRHGKQVKVREVDLPDEQAALEYARKFQRQRRNLTREAQSYFRGQDYNALKQQRGGNRRGPHSKDQNDTLKNTAQQLALKYQVSPITIKRDGKFAQAVDRIAAAHGDPDVKRRLLGGDVRLKLGLARGWLKLPAEELKAAVDQFIEQADEPVVGKKKGAAAGRDPEELAQALFKRLQPRGQERAAHRGPPPGGVAGDAVE